MYKLSTFLFVLFLSSTLIFAQDGRDNSKRPTSFNNPEVVYGPVTDGVDNFSESFEDVTFPPAGWVKASPDGGTGWNRQVAGTTPIPGWNGGTVTAPPGGGNAVAFCTWNTGGASANDQWLITPQITDIQAGDSISFWMLLPGYANAYAENVDILISTTGTATTDFTTTVELLTFPANHTDTVWTRYSYALTDFAAAGSDIYVAFREHVADNLNDGSAVMLDLVEVVVGGVSNQLFFENFDSYTAGSNLVAQNPAFWTTWDGGAGQDPLVSNAFSYSAPNSVVIVQNNDLVKDFGVAYTSGKYKIKFYAYIPATKAGYFNTLATFAGSNSDWGLECYFDAGGTGRVLGGSATAVPFSWPVATWFPVENVVDLDANLATVTINGVLVHSWQWTLGANGSGAPLTLDANDFFGATANDQMFVDDYSLEDLNVVPVELSAFVANVSNNTVTLNWTTETELNNQGFEVQRRLAEGQFITIGHVQGFGTTTERKQYSFTDAGLETGNYYYRLKQVDFNGVYEYSNEIFVEVNPPLVFGLDQNYPNPFNPTTSINFSLAEPSFVKLAVYNLLGEEVALLKNEFMTAGSFNVSFDAASLPSGMYLYKLETAQFSSVRKMMLMK